MNKDRGPNDLEHLLEQRQEEIDMLKKQKEYMQKKCREAGEAVLKQEARYNALVKEYDKALEEIDNLKVMMKS
jgi:hypothetical protein|tara:strand:- start:730 stop:948 length:219 start_codon:yes stop_codon:yes gene_type:complete